MVSRPYNTNLQPATVFFLSGTQTSPNRSLCALWYTRFNHHYFCTADKSAAEFFYYKTSDVAKRRFKYTCKTQLEVSSDLSRF